MPILSFMNDMYKSIPVKSGENTKLGRIVNAEEKQQIKWKWNGLLDWSQ